MTANTGVMPFTYLVHTLWTSLSGDYSGIISAQSSGEIKHLFSQAINLWSRLDNFFIFILIPIGIYMLIRRLRYLGRLNQQHRNIFDAHLGMGSPEQAPIDVEPNTEKGYIFNKEKKDFFPMPQLDITGMKVIGNHLKMYTSHKTYINQQTVSKVEK